MSELNAHDRERLRQFALGLSTEREREAIDRRVREDAAWASALETERNRLEALDALDDNSPPTGLAERTIGNVIDRARAAERRKRVPWGLSAAFAAATFALVFGAIWVATGYQQQNRQALAERNMQQIALAFKMYANESRGEKFPPLAPYEGVWMFDVAVLYPEYIRDPAVLVSPLLPDYGPRVRELESLLGDEDVDWRRVTEIAAASYFYTGYMIREPEDLETVVAMRSDRESTAYDEDVETDGVPVFRLREGIERYLITDINNAGASNVGQSQVPILFESRGIAERRSDGATGVAYLDGHVQVEDAANANPVIRRILELLSSAHRTPR